MRRAGLLVWVCRGFMAGVVASCFTPPADDVLFRCEPEGASTCPPDYVCLADGCCHREGTALADDNYGLCGGMLTGTDGASGSSGSDTGAMPDTDTETGSGGSSDTMDGSSDGPETSSTSGL